MDMTWMPCLFLISFLIVSEGRTLKKRGKFCYYDGVNFEEGNEIITLDGCETCKCEDGKPVCSTNPECSGCRYAGEHYKPGETKIDGCQICTCQAGGDMPCEQINGCKKRSEAKRRLLKLFS